MRRSVAMLAAAGLAAVGPAARAQDRAIGGAHSSQFVDVRVQYSIRLPVKSDDADAQREAMEQGRKMLYEMSANECTLMLATISSDCRLKDLNIQANVLPQKGQDDLLNLTASARYMIELKAKP